MFAMTKPKSRAEKFSNSTLKVKTSNRGIMDMKSPKKNEDNMSPIIIVQMATGQQSSLSRVFERVSQGAMEGPTDVAVKNAVIPNNPGNISFRGMFLPIT